MSARSLRSGVSLVWNKGIAAECDRRIPDEFCGGIYQTDPILAGALYSRHLPHDLIPNPEKFDDIRDGELIWVRLSWLESFVTQVLPRIKSSFILVTSDSDSSVPSELGADADCILNNPKIVHWFTQNYDGSRPNGKISAIPIGIDFHTLAAKSTWGEDRASPERQEQVLGSVSHELAPTAKRLPRAYVDFAWQKSLGLRHYRRYHPLKGTSFHESRRKISRIVGQNPAAFCQAGPLPRTEMWRQRGEYAFVLSPHGMGLDCHRTWEALALGHIVLVPTSSLDNLYEGLPVISFKDWSEINQSNLEKWLYQYQGDAEVLPTLLTVRWVDWMRRVASGENLCPPAMLK